MAAAREIRKRVDVGALEQESFWVVALNSRQHVLEVFEVSRGTVSQVDVHPRDVFRPLVRMNAHSCVLAHNHPTQDPTPSEADKVLAVRMVQAGKLLGIPVLDSLVLTGDSHTSMAQEDMLPG